MNKIDKRLQKIQKEKRLGFMTHVVVGYPSLEKTISLVQIMEQAGADFVELQIPFSDPLADGPTIMKACEASLEAGTRVEDAFDIASKLNKTVSIPLLFMAYYNTVFKYGAERFCRNSKKAGISGLIVPDIPIEEEKSEHFLWFCKKYDLFAIRVISPASTIERIKKNVAVAKGFVYCTARQGTTDAARGLDPKLASYLKTVRKEFSIPIAVGFGISNKERINIIRPYADIAVIGSAVIDVVNSSKEEEMEKNIASFLKNLIV